MSYDEPLVGFVAIALAVIAAVIAVGPWDQPYQLRSIVAIRLRYGKLVARGVWVAIAIAAFTSGIAILSGMRPSYAEQHSPANVEH